MWNPFRKKGSPYNQYEDNDPFKYPGYPGGGPFKKESLYDYHVRVWEALDPDIKARAAKHLREALDPVSMKAWKERAQADPEDWMIEDHHFAGTAFRNLLRKEIKDNELPSGNWDDYYVMAIEAAAGIRSC